MQEPKKTSQKNEYARVCSKKVDTPLYDNVYVHEILCTKISSLKKEMFRVPNKSIKEVH